MGQSSMGLFTMQSSPKKTTSKTAFGIQKRKIRKRVGTRWCWIQQQPSTTTEGRNVVGGFVTMVPPTRKRLASTPSQRSASSSTRKSANAGSKTPATKKNKSTGSNHVTTVTRPLSDLGFSSTKRPKYQIGTKMLLDDSIYDKEAPAEVKGHYFVYEISSICESGRTVTIQYKNQVVRNGGNMFRVYKEGEDSQVCFLFVRFVCLFISFVIWIRSYKIIDCLCALSFLLNSS